jgi:hypothetical protein
VIKKYKTDLYLCKHEDRKMRRFTDPEREHFRHLVLDCIVQRFTTQESLHHVKDKLGIEIGADHFNHVRAELKQDVKKKLKTLEKRQVCIYP